MVQRTETGPVGAMLRYLFATAPDAVRGLLALALLAAAGWLATAGAFLWAIVAAATALILFYVNGKHSRNR